MASTAFKAKIGGTLDASYPKQITRVGQFIRNRLTATTKTNPTTAKYTPLLGVDNHYP
jgi:hypothetical protein